MGSKNQVCNLLLPCLLQGVRQQDAADDDGGRGGPPWRRALGVPAEQHREVQRPGQHHFEGWISSFSFTPGCRRAKARAW